MGPQLQSDALGSSDWTLWPQRILLTTPEVTWAHQPLAPISSLPSCLSSAWHPFKGDFLSTCTQTMAGIGGQALCLTP